jgi:hypothetical protein
MSPSNDAGFDFDDGPIDYLDGAAAMAAFIMLGSLQLGSCFAQMGERSAHVGLVGPNGLKAHRRDQC